MAGGKVLIVDDETAIPQSTQLLLEDLGFNVVACDQAGKIMETIEREAPDVLLQGSSDAGA